MKNKCPDEIVLDSSAALIGACVKTFAECINLNAYLTTCGNALLLDTELPKCFIRLDRSHFVKMVLRNKDLRKADIRMSKLIHGVMGYIIVSENMDVDQCECILQHIFTLTKNAYVNSDVVSSRIFLEELVATHSFKLKQEGNENMFAEPTDTVDSLQETDSDECQREIDTKELPVAFYDGNQNYKGTSMYRWIMRIYESVQSNHVEKGIVENGWYSSAVEKFVFETFVRLPMWSNIMCQKFNSNNFAPTSSASESEFKNIKKLGGINTKRVDVFVDKHLNLLSGNTKLALGDQISSATNARSSSSLTKIKHKAKAPALDDSTDSINASLNRSQSDNDISIAHDSHRFSMNRSQSDVDLSISENVSENWKNKNRSLPLFRRSKTSILERHDVNYFCHGIPILRNGHTTKSRKTGRKSIVVTNTCAMDSILAIYCSAYLDNNVAKREINESTASNKFSSFIKSFFSCEKRSIKHYDKRTELLLDIFTVQSYPTAITENEHVRIVKCETGVASFFEKLSNEDGMMMASVKRKKQCATCSYENISHSALTPIRVSVSRDTRLENIERYIITNDDGMAPECRACGNHLTISEEFGNIIAIEAEPLSHNSTRQMRKYEIQQLKEKICIKGELYQLFGIIQYIPQIKHFVAHIKRNNGVWQTVDDLETEVKTTKKIEEIPMHIFMLFYIRQTK